MTDRSTSAAEASSSTVFEGWNTPKPYNYDCPDHIWRRMPLCFQNDFISNSKFFIHSPGVNGIKWMPNMGADLEDFEKWRRHTPDRELTDFTVDDDDLMSFLGWNTPKPDDYDCPEHIWRRMPLSFQKKFIERSKHGGLDTKWMPNSGLDVKDFREWRRHNGPRS